MNEIRPLETDVTLTNCDREPIHIPGTVQPIGFLVACDAAMIITRAANTTPHIDIAPADLLGTALADLLAPEFFARLQDRLVHLRGADSMERIFGQDVRGDGAMFDVAVHRSGDEIVIECEPGCGDHIEVSAQVREIATRLRATENEIDILQEGANELRALSGFDRVKVYRFSDDGSGAVIAESRGEGIDSYLGLNFPTTDIPVQARALYKRNIFRIISDVDAKPVPLVSVADSEPLDMSLALFRAVSPIHIEYLANMGVAASLSVSILVDGELWGLFACHNNSPLLPSFAQRSAAELFGQMFSLLLEARLRDDASTYEEGASRIADKLLAAAADDKDVLKDAQRLGDLVRAAIPAEGIGVAIDGTYSLSGETPNADQFATIVAAVAEHAERRVYATHKIADLLPAAADYAETAAGLLAIPISRQGDDMVVLFRPEHLRSVRWAGDQEKHVELGPNGPRLTPRKSFEEWSELVRGESQPFNRSERRIAEALRTSLLEVVLKLTESAHDEQVRASEKQNLLIAELNHRVRNILALIRALMGQTSREAGSIGDFVGTLDGRVQALALAHDQLTAKQWSPASLRDLIATEARAYLDRKSSRVHASGPEALLQPEAFTVLALVIHELTTNAAKYGALSDSGKVDVNWRFEDDALVIEWRESGGPTVHRPQRRGFGTTIIATSIPHELGGEATVDYAASGLRARFAIPLRHAERGVEASGAAAPKQRVSESPLNGARVLLVEDSSLIALDAEQKLQNLGAADVVMAASNAAAARALEEGGIDCAMLDFNLGQETSLATAERLSADAIPFVFATGYGADGTIPAPFDSVPIVLKPYAEKQIVEAFAQLDG